MNIKMQIKHNSTNLIVYDKKNQKIILIEVGMPNLDLLTQVENKKLRKYNLIANIVAIMYKSSSKIITCIMIRGVIGSQPPCGDSWAMFGMIANVICPCIAVVLIDYCTRRGYKV